MLNNQYRMKNFEVRENFKIEPARSCLLAIRALYPASYVAETNNQDQCDIELWQAGIQHSYNAVQSAM
jgi:hypothetical protein